MFYIVQILVISVTTYRRHVICHRTDSSSPSTQVSQYRFSFTSISFNLMNFVLIYLIIPYSHTFNYTHIYRLAGQIGWIVSIAPDVVKSTIQTSEAPMGILETTKQIVASRGIRGLFAGVEVRNRIDILCNMLCIYTL